MQIFEWLKLKMKFTFKKNKKSAIKDNRVIDSSPIQDQEEKVNMLKVNASADHDNKNENDKKIVEQNLINKRLPKELIIRIFSYLDIVSLCRCAQVSKYWNILALDGSNLQHVDLFEFQRDVSENVIENIALRCNEFLRSIRLENCRSINDTSLKTLCIKCPNVELLNLKQCLKLTEKSFVNIGNNLQYLTSLNLESCNISDQGIKCIAKGCSRLQAIEISWCINISSDGLFNFADSCSNLRHIAAKGLTNMKNRVLAKIADNCPQLISLILNNCNSLTDDGIISIADNCQFLKHLCVSNCKHLTDASLIALGRNCHELCLFESSGCSNLSDNGFSALSKGCPNLMRIDLEECLQITNATIQNLANNCFKLRHLALSRCENITDDGIRLITNPTTGNLNETLQVLELDNCPLITDAALDQLSSCQNLMRLELYDCQLITKNGIKKFQSKFPQIKVHAYFAPTVASNHNRPIRSCSCKCCVIL
ncbi:F-box LRR-repeat 2-like [Brachionus plicatilis]|uniref:F-box LRR-repeat 2-like n=1 Tax=Brachionus plicatilis TaxID=10195 RepID=A0A3M7R2G5_BRAPC|nr:F-box LRR-repeat 2-like [Brachionus plicatilis]